MANKKQLEILKRGIDVWNKWRKENPSAEIDLEEASLREIDLNTVNLNNANLRGADLFRADLIGTNLVGASLGEANLSKANLSEANLTNANLGLADLNGANLINADLSDADLFGADLIGTNLSKAVLRRTNFTEAILIETNLSKVLMAWTILSNIDLSKTIGLEKVIHEVGSTLGNETMKRSNGKIPKAFLRGCGLSDWEIESAKLYNPDLSNEEINKTLYKVYDLRAQQPLQISPLFISYSHTDSEFVDKLENYLNKKGVRFWRDKHDATAGRLETQIDRAIHQNPTVLLILSENSIKSDWVEHEVRKAREMEKDIGRDVLCPVALDDSWKTSPWPERIMEQVMEYNILDFSIWTDDGKFEKMFVKLIDGLNLYYKK
jgi:uncharacterized protein YjbI with pentapeptide repeats